MAILDQMVNGGGMQEAPVSGPPMAPPGQQPQGQSMGNEQVPEEEQPNVSPEEQQIYDTVVTNAQNIIYSKDSSTNILNIVASADNPAEGVAQATVTIGEQIVTQAESQQMQIPDDILSAASDEIIEMVFELAQAANIVQEITEDDLFTAMARTMDLWKEMHPERFDANAAAQDLQGMDKSQVMGVLNQLGI